MLSKELSGVIKKTSQGIVNFVFINLPKSVAVNAKVLSTPSKDDLVPNVTFLLNSSNE